MKITDFINADTIEKMREEISRANGNEVFFRGVPDEAGVVSEVEVIARGNEYSVAALLNIKCRYICFQRVWKQRRSILHCK